MTKPSPLSAGAFCNLHLTGRALDSVCSTLDVRFAHVHEGSSCLSLREVRGAQPRRADTQPWLTATLAIIVIVAAFLLPFVAGWMKMPTEIVSDEAPFSMLWGLIEFGGGKVVTHAQGFVHGPEFWPTVRMVAGFVFGIKAVSTGSRLF